MQTVIISNTHVKSVSMAGNAPHMTSLEIAELTGKQHKNVMQAIRNMEPAWEKICGLKFQLTSCVTPCLAYLLITYLRPLLR